MAPVGRRIRSWLWDYLIITAWLVIMSLLAWASGAAGLIDLRRVFGGLSLPSADLGYTLLTVVPLWLYLTATEASEARASWGNAGRTCRSREWDRPCPPVGSRCAISSRCCPGSSGTWL